RTLRGADGRTGTPRRGVVHDRLGASDRRQDHPVPSQGADAGHHLTPPTGAHHHPMGERGRPTSYPDGHDRLAKVRLLLSRVFGDGANPLAWGFRIFSIRGIIVRVHLLFIVYLLAELIFTLPGNREGLVFVLPRLIAMLTL